MPPQGLDNFTQQCLGANLFRIRDPSTWFFQAPRPFSPVHLPNGSTSIVLENCIPQAQRTNRGSSGMHNGACSQLYNRTTLPCADKYLPGPPAPCFRTRALRLSAELGWLQRAAYSASAAPYHLFGCEGVHAMWLDSSLI